MKCIIKCVFFTLAECVVAELLLHGDADAVVAAVLGRGIGAGAGAGFQGVAAGLGAWAPVGPVAPQAVNWELKRVLLPFIFASGS